LEQVSIEMDFGGSSVEVGQRESMEPSPLQKLSGVCDVSGVLTTRVAWSCDYYITV